MNGKRMILLTVAVLLPFLVGESAGQENLQSLRGVNPIENASAIPENQIRKTDRTPMTRNFVQQPPLIPHPTRAYAINLKSNKCLSCHGLENYEESEAPGISQTHYQNRDGVTLADVSAARYFCTQCHVEQFVVDPLVENDFKPAKPAQ